MINLILPMMFVMHNLIDPAHRLYSRSAKRKRRGMALIKLGGGVADIRGSIGGTVFSKNRYGSYARTRTIPVDPQSTLQTKIRSVMGAARYAWFNVLSTAQKAAWDVYAANVSMLNRLGESINLTGYGHFCRSACSLLYNDLPIVADGPTDYSLAEQDATFAVSASEATQELTVTFDDDAEWCDEDGAHLFLYASRPQNPTINYFKGPYQIAGVIAGSSTTPPTTGETIAVPFAVVEGHKVFVQARIVRADGRLSEPLFAVTAIVGPNPPALPSGTVEVIGVDYEILLTFPVSMDVSSIPDSGDFVYIDELLTEFYPDSSNWVDSSTLRLLLPVSGESGLPNSINWVPFVRPLRTLSGYEYPAWSGLPLLEVI